MSIEAPKVHVHMTVSNLEKSRAFYEKFFGTAPVKVKPGYVKFLPPFGPLNLALSEAAPVESRGHVDHMGIQVESAEIVMRELVRVKAAGLPVREEMGVNCCHANQDKFWVEDPRSEEHTSELQSRLHLVCRLLLEKKKKKKYRKY